jgi:hypothetical protein
VLLCFERFRYVDLARPTSCICSALANACISYLPGASLREQANRLRPASRAAFCGHTIAEVIAGRVDPVSTQLIIFGSGIREATSMVVVARNSQTAFLITKPAAATYPTLACQVSCFVAQLTTRLHVAERVARDGVTQLAGS